MLPSVRSGYVNVCVVVPVAVKSVLFPYSVSASVGLYLQVESSFVVILIVVEVVPAVRLEMFVGMSIVIIGVVVSTVNV